MLHRTPFARIALPVAAAVAFALTGCVDNSGGLPPAGESIAFEIANASPDLFCNSFEDAAHLIRSQDDIDAFVDACEVLGDEETIADVLAAELASLDDGQALVFVSVQLGGCLGEWAVEAVHLDGDVLRPWILKADSAYGRQSVACTADIGEGHQLLRVDGADAAASIELTVGTYNPDLPGAPERGQMDGADAAR